MTARPRDDMGRPIRRDIRKDTRGRWAVTVWVRMYLSDGSTLVRTARYRYRTRWHAARGRWMDCVGQYGRVG